MRQIANEYFNKKNYSESEFEFDELKEESEEESEEESDEESEEDNIDNTRRVRENIGEIPQQQAPPTIMKSR
jgi:hypothetical protein